MEAIEKNPSLFIVEGILLIVLGTLAIVLPQLTTIGIGLIVGWVLLVGGFYRFFRSLKLRNELKHLWLALLSSVIAIMAGIYVLSSPVKGIFIMTLLLAVFFLIDGIYSILISLTSKSGEYWSYLLLSGIIAIVLSVLILSGLPYTARWAIGLLIGINMLSYGFAIALNAGSVQKSTQQI